jgi:hypothetical protein
MYSAIADVLFCDKKKGSINIDIYVAVNLDFQ